MAGPLVFPYKINQKSPSTTKFGAVEPAKEKGTEQRKETWWVPRVSPGAKESIALKNSAAIQSAMAELVAFGIWNISG